MGRTTVEIARERAEGAARGRTFAREPDGRPRTRLFAVGDPQAPLEKFLGVLDAHDALGDDGLLSPQVFLVSMGDHFDWGGRADREQAAEEGLALLAWLAAHPTDQVVLLLGNHDLGRVGELARFDDRSFPLARGEADVIYGDGTRRIDAALEERFRQLHPELPTAEVAARDFSTFRLAQRQLVEALLRAQRFRIAHAPSPGMLLSHAGVTRDELDAAGVPARDHGDAVVAAAALDAALDDAVAAWDGASPLTIGALHVPGSATSGEGRGMFYHRPSNPDFEAADHFEGPPRRRFDPRRLPIGMVQAIGHVRDAKCRALLREWHDGAPAEDGPLRHLVTDGSRVRYARGVPSRWDPGTAGMIFLDGGMGHAPASTYELLDLATGRPAVRREA